MNERSHVFRFIQNLLIKKGFILSFTMKVLDRKRSVEVYSGMDYFRISSFELAANEIYVNNVKGNVCELGVYKGDSAQYINAFFPDRILYLFDTFEGFDVKDTDIDLQKNYSTERIDFSDTSVDLVLKKMKYPENCLVKKGYFPKTTVDLEDEFAFVSIDADLFQPVYEGLKYFFPRLSKGGYIFIHDFNNRNYLGAKEAVKKYCKENDLSYFPLCDSCGSVVINK